MQALGDPLRKAGSPTEKPGATTTTLRYEPYPAAAPRAGTPASRAGYPAAARPAGTCLDAPPLPPLPHPLTAPHRMQQQHPEPCAPLPSSRPNRAPYSPQQKRAEYLCRTQARTECGAAAPMAQGPQPSQGGGAPAVAGAAYLTRYHAGLLFSPQSAFDDRFVFAASSVLAFSVHWVVLLLRHEGGGRVIDGDFTLGRSRRDDCDFIHVGSVQQKPSS
eukprot:TRINITY_DN6120_c0_g1_i2.p3 TRINITY_DN6120_c0_g1~~TRINITY_DN6120_c0_g1_i2.p3  ORF type:complete len:218 (+),score=28.13 TRINITY_DN6120_c0_g1_i2:149-802(+)